MPVMTSVMTPEHQTAAGTTSGCLVHSVAVLSARYCTSGCVPVGVPTPGRHAVTSGVPTGEAIATADATDEVTGEAIGEATGEAQGVPRVLVATGVLSLGHAKGYPAQGNHHDNDNDQK